MSGTKREHSASASTQNIPPQTFPLAHPPPKSTSNRQCLRLSSRLLLQIQQLTPSSTKPSLPPRAIPILELYQPSTFGKSVTRAPGARKVHSRDLYLRQSDSFTHLKNKSRGANGEMNGHGSNGNGYSNGTGSGNGNTKPRSGSGASSKASSKSKSSSGSRSRSGSGIASGDEDDREKRVTFKSRRRRRSTSSPGDNNEDDEDGEGDVVAVIYTSPKPKSKTKNEQPPEAELFFPISGSSWEASSPAPGRYRFSSPEIDGNENNAVVFEWEKRPPSRSSPVSGGGSEKGTDDDRFVLSLSGTNIESTSLRRPWLTQLTRRGLHVGGLDAWQGDLRALGIDDGGESAGLYMLILTMGVWVARREGWVL
ncbi:hypothetical protein BDV12DRAFT_174921 [Aspergillus spectabilis]